jgi:hypothetical protein
LNCSNDFGPASRPCQPSGISLTSTVCVLAVFENYLLQLHQLGCEFAPFSFANLKISKANSCLSSSQIEFPILRLMLLQSKGHPATNNHVVYFV